MSKKGQSISINTIIVAAIALAVLVVLFVIFTGRLGMFSKGVAETTTCDNACKALGKTSGSGEAKLNCEGGGGAAPLGIVLPGKFDDVKGENICCCK